MKRLNLTLLLLGSVNLIAQTNKADSLDYADKKIKAEFPKLRLLNIEYQTSFSRNYDSELNDQAFREGEIDYQNAINISANVPFKKYKKWLFSVRGDFTHYTINNTIDATNFEESREQTNRFDNYALGINAQYFGQFKKKLLIYNSTITVDANEDGIQRLRGSVAASVLLKKTKKETLTLGAVFIADPASQIPIAPLLTYNRQFDSSAWEFDLILPQRMLFRRPLGKFDRLSIGSSLGGANFYVENQQLPRAFVYNQLEINSGVMYERLFARNFIITVGGGITHFVSQRFTEKGKLSSDYIYKNTQEATPYLNFGFSYFPTKKKNPTKK